MRPETTLTAVRAALAIPFADPVNVGGLTMPRAEARALERLITQKQPPRSAFGAKAGGCSPVPNAAAPATSFSPSAGTHSGAGNYARSTVDLLSQCRAGGFSGLLHPAEVTNA